MKKERSRVWFGSIGMVVFFMFITSIVLAESLEKGSDWISNGLVKVSASSESTTIGCAIRNTSGSWKGYCHPRDWGLMGKGENLMTLYDESNEEIKTSIEDGKAVLCFKKVNKNFKSGENQNGWRRYQVTIFPESYQVKINCIDSSIENKCNWYIMAGSSDYLMSENEFWDAADVEGASKGISTGDNEYGVLWGLNTERLIMLHYPGIEHVSGYCGTGQTKTWIQFMLMRYSGDFSVFVHPVKKMMTEDEVKEICNKLVKGVK